MQRNLAELNIVRIHNPINTETFNELGDGILRAFNGIIKEYSLVDHDMPSFESVQPALLTRALDEKVGGHILGLTTADLLNDDPDEFYRYIFAGKDNNNDVAIVSTKRIPSKDNQTLFERILKLSLHELGHNFGLGHHYSYEKAGDGAYCPMTKGDYNRFGQRGYVRAVIDARGFMFCDNCMDFLESHY